MKNIYVTLFSIIGLYLAHTLPLYFITFAMPTILRAEGASLIGIGLLGYLMIPWAFKFLWATWLDRFYSTRWGKRKSWIIPTQLMIVILLLILFYTVPADAPLSLFAILFGISLFAATHDIASGAYVIEQLKPEQRRWGNYAQVIGTTLGSACGGALILFSYGYWGWKVSLICIISLASIVFIWVSTIKEIPNNTLTPRETPSLKNFWRRENLRALLYMCLIYRGCEGLVMGMQQPFLVDQHIPVDKIGLMMGVGNLTLGLVGAGLTGFFLKSFKNWRVLAFLGVLRTLVYFSLFWLAYLGVQHLGLLFGVVLINMAIRLMEMVTLYTIFMNECGSNQAGTDFSILICGELIIYMLGISLSGFLASVFGYAGLFLLGSLLSIPSLLFSVRILRKNTSLPAGLIVA